MPTNFSMPPASRKALAFSMFLVMTSCRVQHTAVTVSSDMALLAALLLLFPPGSRWTRSRMAYLPLEKKTKGRVEMWSKPRKSVEGEVQTGVKKRTQEATLMQCCLFPITDYSLWGNHGHIHREYGISSQQMYGLLVLDGWTSYFMPLSLSFLNCEARIMVPPLQGCCEEMCGKHLTHSDDSGLRTQ